MSSIVGLQGKFNVSELIEMLKTSKNPGIDSSGIYLDDIELNIDMDKYENNNEYNFGLAHNLSAVYDVSDRISIPQPVKYGNLILVLDGVLYNFHTVKNLLSKLGIEEDIKSDAEALVHLIDFYNKGNLVSAINSSIRMIDGDYAFAVWDGKNLAIARDSLGVKPLFYSINNNFNGFASVKESLTSVGFRDIRTLKPGHILFNWSDISPQQHIHEKIMDVDASKLEKLLKLSVSKRVEELDNIGVIFSGGVDSSILTLFLKDISFNKKLDITLYSVGVKNSKDIEAAEYAAEYLELPLKTQTVSEELIRDNLKEVVHAIGDDNLMKIGVGMTTYLATKMIAEDNIKVVISGQGADELFGGYKRYIKSYLDGKLDWELRSDISNMYHVNLERDYACSMINGVELRLPFLDKNLVEYALNLPVKYKISGEGDILRKNILRKLAFNSGLDIKIAYRPKKAAQYGSGIDKILRKKIIKDVDLSSYL